MPADLQAVIDAWPSLPNYIKVAVCTLIGGQLNYAGGKCEQKDCSEYMTKKLLWWNIIVPDNLPAIDLWHDQRLEAARRYCREQGTKKKLRGRK